MKLALGKYLWKVLKNCSNEICTNEICKRRGPPCNFYELYGGYLSDQSIFLSNKIKAKRYVNIQHSNFNRTKLTDAMRRT